MVYNTIILYISFVILWYHYHYVTLIYWYQYHYITNDIYSKWYTKLLHYVHEDNISAFILNYDIIR